MKTRLSAGNPFGPTRSGFAWEKIPSASQCHIDVGCARGNLLHALRQRGMSRLVGVDVSREAIEAGRQLYPDIELLHRLDTVPLPFEDESFDSASLLDVLEHVYGQQALLAELNRVLKVGGTLVVTVPRRHVFSFLDLGNLKFRFPRLHRWFYCLAHSREAYEKRYVAGENDLIGDISARKRWHEHFTSSHLGELLEEAGFCVIEFDGAALIRRVVLPLRIALSWSCFFRRLFAALDRLDARWFASSDLFCVAVKKA